ncbi:hypothetical protein [Salinimicrobium xinjiangense]|uniref:hypothetical protein n=1 Tax=Salinimicrobium xinjiangense TaxID=438596 RepID=UPI00048EC572|nr:hypothetical protein [Salinimicrobium xinjiangense]
MKKISLIAIIALVLWSCGSTQSVKTTMNADGSSQRTVSNSNVFGSKDIAVLKEEWEYETLVETGEAPVLNKYDEVSRNRLLARKGAILEAQRKLAEKIGTIRLNATTTMQDYAATDFVQSRINVFLKDVEVIGEEHDEKNGIYKVTVQMPKVKLVNILEEYLTP